MGQRGMAGVNVHLRPMQLKGARIAFHQHHASGLHERPVHELPLPRGNANQIALLYSRINSFPIYREASEFILS